MPVEALGIDAEKVSAGLHDETKGSTVFFSFLFFFPGNLMNQLSFLVFPFPPSMEVILLIDHLSQINLHQKAAYLCLLSGFTANQVKPRWYTPVHPNYLFFFFILIITFIINMSLLVL